MSTKKVPMTRWRMQWNRYCMCVCFSILFFCTFLSAYSTITFFHTFMSTIFFCAFHNAIWNRLWNLWQILTPFFRFRCSNERKSKEKSSGKIHSFAINRVSSKRKFYCANTCETTVPSYVFIRLIISRFTYSFLNWEQVVRHVRKHTRQEFAKIKTKK